MSWKVTFTPDARNPNIGVAHTIYVDDATSEEFSADFTLKYPSDSSALVSQVKPWIVDLMDKKRAAEAVSADLAAQLQAAFGDKL